MFIKYRTINDFSEVKPARLDDDTREVELIKN